MEIVKQTFKVFDNFLEITPEEALQTNSIYEIKIKGLRALNKNKKLDVLKAKIVTELTPSYCSVESINALVEVFDIPEDRLLFYIREASRYADYLSNTSKTRTKVDFEVEQFVKTKACLDALLKAYIEKASDSGAKGTLGDITFENSENFGSIKDLIKALKDELKKWEDAVRGFEREGRAKPKATKIGMKASTNSDITQTTIDSILNDITRARAQE